MPRIHHFRWRLFFRRPQDRPAFVQSTNHRNTILALTPSAPLHVPLILLKVRGAENSEQKQIEKPETPFRVNENPVLKAL